MRLAHFVALGLVMVLPASASAAIVDGSFSGTVTSSYDWTGELSGAIGDDTLVGQPVSGTFSYDTDNAPLDSFPTDSLLGIYETFAPIPGSWLSMSINVGGYAMDASSNDFSRRINVQDYSSFAGDAFFVESESVDEEPDSDPTTDSYYYRQANFFLLEYVVDLLASDALPVNLDWFDDDLSDISERWGQGFFFTNDYVYRLPDNPLGEGYTYHYDAWATFRVEDVTLAEREGEVLEPPAFILLTIGLAGFAYSYRTRSNSLSQDKSRRTWG